VPRSALRTTFSRLPARGAPAPAGRQGGRQGGEAAGPAAVVVRTRTQARLPERDEGDRARWCFRGIRDENDSVVSGAQRHLRERVSPALRKLGEAAEALDEAVGALEALQHS